MKKQLIFLILFILYSISVFSQVPYCGSHDKFLAALKANPNGQSELKTYLDKLEKNIKIIIEKLRTPDLHSSPVTIPVVFHILKNNSAINFTVGEIQNVIDSLNYYFGKGSKFILPPTKFMLSFKRESNIRFVLAKRTPDNKVTNGINTITPTSMNKISDTDVKFTAKGGIDAWDQNKYLNIWVCDLAAGPGKVLFGVGTFPDTKYSEPSGIVLHYFMIKNSLNVYCQKMRTIGHEMGHFLGLRHIWGDCGENCKGEDYVDDTPLTILHNNNCPTPDDGHMYMNYMDYSCDDCRYMFTRGQIARMLSTLYPGGPRASLLVSPALISPTATERNFDVPLEGESENLPSWKAALIMLWGWANGATPNLDQLITDTKSLKAPGLTGLPSPLIEVCKALALINYNELMVSYSISGFYSLLSNGPIVMISSGTSGDLYGLIITGISFDASGRGQVRISDPLNIGEKGFNFQYKNTITKVTEGTFKGSEYIVDYEKFMVDAVEKAVIANKKIYIFYPPTKSNN